MLYPEREVNKKWNDLASLD